MDIPFKVFVVSLLMMFLAVPLILKKVPKNGLYGFRTPKTLSGPDEQWYQVNQEAGIGMFIAGMVSFVACLIVPLVCDNRGEVVQICTVVLLGSLCLAVGVGMAKHWK
jgi:uncharacterized membrane protein